MDFITNNAVVISTTLAISAFVLSLSTFIKQHFSINVIAYPVLEKVEYKLIIENVGNYPAERTTVEMRLLEHHQEYVRELLETTPFLLGEVSITLPSKTPYAFVIGSMYEIEKDTILPIIELTIKHKNFMFFERTKKITIDYNIFKNQLKFG